MNNGIRQWIINPLIIGGTFWLTDGLLYFSARFFTSTRAWIIIKTISLPVLTLAVFILVVNKRTESKRDILLSAFVGLLFIWLLSAVYMFVMSAFSDKGIMPLQGLGWLFIGFPMTAIEASTYSGGLFGLLATSIGLPLVAIFIKEK
jgi:hypothetical protein